MKAPADFLVFRCVGGACGESSEKEMPPEELLRLLETAEVNTASSAFQIKTGLFVSEVQLS